MTAATPPVAAPEDVYVRRILAADDFPAFSKVMNDLIASLRDDDASAQRLANLVLRDYALTVKVIRTANTVHYNRSGRAVQSATHALMLLGARTVRDLACGLLLFEQYRGRSPGLKELMLLSLLTASHAREASARRGIGDPETAQLCGMFRNLGEVLVAAHLPEEYANVLRQTKETALAMERAGQPGGASRARIHATVAVLNCSFEDIGVAIARHWGMPDIVRRGMRACGAPGEDPTELATAFGHDLATAIYREDQEAGRAAVARVMHAYGSRLDLTREALAATADAAVAETRDTFASARVALDDLRLTRQIARALTASGRATPTGGAGTLAADGATPNGAVPNGSADASGAGADAAAVPNGAPVSGPALAALRERLTSDLAAAAADVGAYEVQRALLVVLEAALRGGPFDRTCFCAVDVRANEVRARFGLGDGVERLVASLTLPLGVQAMSSGPMLLRGEDVILTLGMRATLHDAQHLRAWGASSAVIVPVTVDGTTIGAIYADRRGHAAALDPTTLGYLRRVAAGASQALTLRRGRGAPAATCASPEPSVVTAAQKAELVLRVLRGESIEGVAEECALGVSELARWRDEFLAGAVARLASV